MKLSTEQIIKLLQIKGIGRGKVFKLIEALSFLPSSNRELAEVVIEHSKMLQLQISSIAEIIEFFQKAETIIAKTENSNIQTISFFDDRYPSNLKKIPSPPVLLNIKGNIKKFEEKPCIAVIGTRNPSLYGKQIGERIGFRLGEEEVNVVSGLALGCDTAAHVGCLRANGTTTAVLAHGLDIAVYPKENAMLAEKILEQGGFLLSEYLVGTRGLPNYFIERDRIQAGLSFATIVIETDIKGGTMHTVNNTIEYNRTLAVFSHPLDKQNDKSRGNQLLISDQKGIPLQTKDDIDFLLNQVCPNRKLRISLSNITNIEDIQLPLYNQAEYESLKLPIEDKKEKKIRKKRSKPNLVQSKFFNDEHNLRSGSDAGE